MSSLTRDVKRETIIYDPIDSVIFRIINRSIFRKGIKKKKNISGISVLTKRRINFTEEFEINCRDAINSINVKRLFGYFLKVENAKSDTNAC